MLTNFNLYYLGVLTNQGEGLVDLEIESIRVLLSGAGRVARRLQHQWHRGCGRLRAVAQQFGRPIRCPAAFRPGMVTQADYAHWRAHFGETAGGGAARGRPPPCRSRARGCCCARAVGCWAVRPSPRCAERRTLQGAPEMSARNCRHRVDRLYPGGAAGRHCDHRHSRGAAVAGDSSSPRSRPPRQLHQ